MQPVENMIYRFRGAIFGLGESSFLLNGTVKKHLANSMNKYSKLEKTIDELKVFM